MGQRGCPAGDAAGEEPSPKNELLWLQLPQSSTEAASDKKGDCWAPVLGGWGAGLCWRVGRRRLGHRRMSRKNRVLVLK